MPLRTVLVAAILVAAGLANAVNAAVVVGAPAPVDTPPSWTGNINALIGGKVLDEDDWEPVEGHAAFGLMFDTRPRSWPVALCINLIGSVGGDEDDDTDIDTVASTGELQLGIKKVFGEGGEIGPFRAWIAGGVSFMTAAIVIDRPNADEIDEDDSAIGGWAGVGCYWTIARHFNIGPAVQFSAGEEVELFGRERQPGGLLVGLNLGYHW